MLWGLAGLMAAVVGIALVAPFLRRREGAVPQASAAWDRRVYRDQLAEVERDLSRGVIGADDASRLRTEIGRKLLEADRAAAGAAAGAAPARRGRVLAAGIALLMLGGAAALYARIGAPGLPDQPIAQRIATAQRAYEARPSQAEAEAQAEGRPAMPRPAPDPSYLRLVEQLRTAVASRPDDPQGLTLLAEHEARLGNIPAAIAAQRHLVELRGADATAADHARLAALMVEAAGGLITAEAEAEIGRALERDPRLPEARYLAGLLEVQNQRPDRAFPIWRDLLEQDPDSPWAAPIRGVIGDLAWFAGQPDYQPPAAPRGPDAAAVAAAGTMSEEERAQMIAGMVEGLEARLASEGGTPEEWARLITALTVQGRADHAREILGEARRVFAGKPEALAPIDAAAAQAGLE